jgi:hypothetical protein
MIRKKDLTTHFDLLQNPLKQKIAFLLDVANTANNIIIAQQQLVRGPRMLPHWYLWGQLYIYYVYIYIYISVELMK